MEWIEFYHTHKEALLRDSLFEKIEQIHKSLKIHKEVNETIDPDYVHHLEQEQKVCYEYWNEYNNYCGQYKQGKCTQTWIRENLYPILIFEISKKL